MANIGFPAKNWQNIHNIQKQIAKYQLKSYVQTKIFCEKRVKNSRFPLYFCPEIKTDGPRPRMVGKL